MKVKNFEEGKCCRWFLSFRLLCGLLSHESFNEDDEFAEDLLPFRFIFQWHKRKGRQGTGNREEEEFLAS